MHLNTTSTAPAPTRKPCIRDMAVLTATLLPAYLVMLVPLPELERRAQEINATHPHFQEETPLVVAWEKQRRQRLQGEMAITIVNHSQVA